MKTDAKKRSEYCSASHVLDICISQIRNALISGDAGISQLSENFVKIAKEADRLEDLVESGAYKEDREALRLVSNTIFETMHDSMEPFQFYDRLTQRLEHVVIALEHLTEYTTLKKSMKKEDVFEKILTCYTLEDEKELLRNLLQDIEYKATDNHFLKSNGTVELF